VAAQWPSEGDGREIKNSEIVVAPRSAVTSSAAHLSGQLLKLCSLLRDTIGVAIFILGARECRGLFNQLPDIVASNGDAIFEFGERKQAAGAHRVFPGQAHNTVRRTTTAPKRSKSDEVNILLSMWGGSIGGAIRRLPAIAGTKAHASELMFAARIQRQGATVYGRKKWLRENPLMAQTGTRASFCAKA
jgi:hypothetical protein